MVPERYVYLIALVPFFIIWLLIFYKRKDIRNELVVMGLLVGVLSVLTSYYWWTIDWWRPLTITGTRVGIEDFMMGFLSGGIMASLYEVIFKKGLYKRKLHHHVSGALTLLFLLAQTTMWLFWGIGLTSFWASVISMLFVGLVLISIRRDLVANAVLSGILMLLVSVLFYLLIMLISPVWIDHTYLSGLSGIKVTGVPVEEYAFWFLAGFVFGPFYEYWQGEKLKKLKAK